MATKRNISDVFVDNADDLFRLKRGNRRRRSSGGSLKTLTDGTETWRLIADDEDCFNWQHTLTSTGFTGTEDIDFYTPYEIDA